MDDDQKPQKNFAFFLILSFIRGFFNSFFSSTLFLLGHQQNFAIEISALSTTTNNDDQQRRPTTAAAAVAESLSFSVFLPVAELMETERIAKKNGLFFFFFSLFTVVCAKTVKKNFERLKTKKIFFYCNKLFKKIRKNMFFVKRLKKKQRQKNFFSFVIFFFVFFLLYWN